MSSTANVPRRVALAGLLAAPAILGRRAAAANTLRVTAYDGFVPPSVQQSFEAATGTRIQIRPAASQAPELTLLTAERDHPITDLCTVVSTRLHQFAAAGIIEPLDIARLPPWSNVEPVYADAPWLKVDGAVMGVPMVVGANVIVYDTREIASPPTSWAALFDPAYRGRVTYDIEDFLLCTMLMQGADPTFMAYLGDEQAARRAVAAACNKLIASKDQVVRFFEEGSELQQLLLGGDAVIAQTYASTPSRLILAGQPFARAVPQEGSMAFAYTLALIKGAPNPDAAYAYLDHFLAAPQAGAVLTRASGYPACLRGASDGLSPLERAAYGLPADALARLRFARAEGQALSSELIDQAVTEVQAG